MMNKKPRIVLLFIALLAGFVFYINVLKPQIQYHAKHYINIHGTYLLHPINMPNFSLNNPHEKIFTQNDLKNHWTLIYFGFTHCGLICPDTLHQLNIFYQTLNKNRPDGKLPKIVFITIDPQRDTNEAILNFIEQFNPAFVALRGSTDQTRTLAARCHIRAIKQSRQSQDYVIDHGTEVLLINPEAKIQAYFSFPIKPENLSKDFQRIVMAYSKARV